MGELSARLGLDELTGAAGRGLIWKALLAEFIGNLMLNLFGCGSCINLNNLSDASETDIVLIALTFGLTIFAVVSAIGHVSGGHINPAVTAGLAAAAKVKPVRAVLYVVVQCAGAAAGSALLRALTPDSVAGLGVTALQKNVSPLQGFGVEFFLGFVLVFVVCGVCDPHKPDSKSTAPLAIGLTVTLGHLLAVDYTGSAMNPARAFGSALVSNAWDNHWVYWAGPAAGGVAAALLYTHVFAAPAHADAQPPRYRPVAPDDKELKRLDSGKADDLA